MKKKILYSTQGHRADIGEYKIRRILPNMFGNSIGPFVFLDHVLPVLHLADEPLKTADDDGAHPHRGIATLTYILNGEAEHFDSKGNHAKVGSGGVQWMKTGNGILHSESMNVDPKTKDLVTHAFQFWINLPSKQKAEAPEYIPLQADEIPTQVLSDERGWIKVIAGKYETLISKIPSYSKQFLYHLHLNSEKQFFVSTEGSLEYAIFLPLHDSVINDIEFDRGHFIEFDNEAGTIEISNNTKIAIDIILFGGEKYTEPIVAQGPFIMNTGQEISEAFKDFREGKYGEINFNNVGSVQATM